ncbi:hypothetical protein A2U01_0085060, partial [Trifolium medium]|nr:hypothetical protein [Trifolium medium]
MGIGEQDEEILSGIIF